MGPLGPGAAQVAFKCIKDQPFGSQTPALRLVPLELDFPLDGCLPEWIPSPFQGRLVPYPLLASLPSPNLIDDRSAALALLSLHGGGLGIKGYKVGSFIVINGLVGARRSTCQLYLPCASSCQPSLLAS